MDDRLMFDKSDNHDLFMDVCNLLNEFRGAADLCDAVIKTGDGGSLPVHRAVLAASSPYFRQIFVFSETPDSGLPLATSRESCNMVTVHIPQVALGLMEAVVNFCYTGQLMSGGSACSGQYRGQCRGQCSGQCRGQCSGQCSADEQRKKRKRAELELSEDESESSDDSRGGCTRWSNSVQSVENMKQAERLLEAGVRFSILGLVAAACDRMVQSLDPDTASGVFRLATRSGCVELGDKAWEYMLDNFTEIATGDDIHFLELDVNDLCSLIADDRLNVRHEAAVFYGIVRWIRHDLDSRLYSLPRLMQCGIRLGNTAGVVAAGTV